MAFSAVLACFQSKQSILELMATVNRQSRFAATTPTSAARALRGATDMTLRLWDLDSGKCIGVLRAMSTASLAGHRLAVRPGDERIMGWHCGVLGSSTSGMRPHTSGARGSRKLPRGRQVPVACVSGVEDLIKTTAGVSPSMPVFGSRFSGARSGASRSSPENP